MDTSRTGAFASVLLLGATALASIARSQPADPIRTISLGSDAAAFVPLPADADILSVDARTGTAAVLLDVHDGSGRLLFYPRLVPPTGAPVAAKLTGALVSDAAPIGVSADPTFVVGDSAGVVHLIDARSGEPLASAGVGAPVTSVLPSQDGSVIFYAVRRDLGGSVGLYVGALGGAELTDLGTFTVPGAPAGAVALPSVAGNGLSLCGVGPQSRSLYVREGGRDVQAWAVDMASLTMHFRSAQHAPRPQITAYGTACGDALWSEGLDRRIRALPPMPLLHLPGTAFVVGCDPPGESDELHVASLNTGEIVRRVSILPAVSEILKQMERPPAIRFIEEMHLDQASSTLLIERTEGVLSVPIGSLDLPDEPVLACTALGSPEALVGTEWRLTLEPSEPGTELSLGHGTGPVRLEGAKLVWRPAFEDIGDRLVPVVLSAGGMRLTQEFEVEVHAPGFQLPFVPVITGVNESGTQLLVVDTAQSAEESRPTRVVVFDVRSGSVVLDWKGDFETNSAVIAEDTVLLAERRADAIRAVRRDGGEQRLFTDGRPQQMRVIAGRVHVHTNRGKAEITLPDLVTREPARVPEWGFRDRQSGTPTPFEGGWLLDGLVRTADLSRPTLIRSLGMRDALDAAGPDPWPVGLPPRTLLPRWGAQVIGTSLVNSGGQVVAQSGDSLDGLVLDAVPIAIFLHEDLVSIDQRHRVQHSLECIEIATGTRRSFPICVSDPFPQRTPRARHRLLHEVPGGLLVIAGDEAVRLTLDDLDLGDPTVPLHFRSEQSALAVNLVEPATLTYGVEGGTPPIMFSLGRELRGVTIDQQTGVVTIEGDDLDFGERVLHAGWAAAETFTSFDRTGEFPQGKEWDELRGDWGTILAEQQRFVRERIGADLTGLPVVLRLGINARDANNQLARLTHEVVLEIPVERLDEAYRRQLRRMMEAANEDGP